MGFSSKNYIEMAQLAMVEKIFLKTVHFGIVYKKSVHEKIDFFPPGLKKIKIINLLKKDMEVYETAVCHHTCTHINLIK